MSNKKQRLAILIANSITSTDERYNVPVDVVRHTMEIVRRNLQQMGEFSFKVEQIIDYNVRRAKNKFARTLQEFVKDSGSGGLVLFYFFGHGVNEDGKLLLGFRNSDYKNPATYYSFDHVVDEIHNNRIRKTLFILDCCYAAAATLPLGVKRFQGGKYFLMGASSAIQKAKIYSDEKFGNFGGFTKCVLHGIESARAAKPFSREITIRDLYDYTEKRMRSLHDEPMPVYDDAGLGNEVFCLNEKSKQIPQEFKEGVSPKTFYCKLRRIVEYLSTNNFENRADFYNYVTQKKDEEFLTFYKLESGTYGYRVIKYGTFEEYLNKCRRLGILSPRSEPTLTRIGSSLIRSQGRRFNTALHSIIIEELGRYRISSEMINEIIIKRIQNQEIPGSLGVHDDLFTDKGMLIEKNWFKFLLDLLGYCGEFNYTTQKIFFPYT